MLWCLIFHSAELQNYVPALHGIMFGSFNLCWEYFTYNQAGSFFEFSPILFGSSELCSERGYSNYVRQVDWQPRDKKFTRSPGARNICLTNLFSCRLIWFAITLTEKRGNFPQKFNCFSTFAFVSIFFFLGDDNFNNYLFTAGSDTPPFGTLETRSKNLNMLAV